MLLNGKRNSNTVTINRPQVVTYLPIHVIKITSYTRPQETEETN